jgi:hypothetical protein
MFGLPFCGNCPAEKNVYTCSRTMFKPWTAIGAVVLAFSLAIPACAYDVPLTEHSIRDAYFLGTRQTSLGPNFLAEYTREIPNLSLGRYRSFASLETPFTQVAVFSSKKLNYSAQDAVKEFLGKPLLFRMHLEICYMVNAPPDALTVRIVQNKKDVLPESSESSLFFPASDEYTSPPSIGETMQFEFSADKIDSSTLTILIDTPDGQHAETVFDLQALR